MKLRLILHLCLLSLCLQLTGNSAAVLTETLKYGVKILSVDTSSMILEYRQEDNQDPGTAQVRVNLAVYPSGPITFNVQDYKIKLTLPSGNTRILLSTDTDAIPLSREDIAGIPMFSIYGFIREYKVGQLILSLQRQFTFKGASCSGEIQYCKLVLNNKGNDSVFPASPRNPQGSIEKMLSRLLVNYPLAEPLRALPSLSSGTVAQDVPGLPFPGYDNPKLPRMKMMINKRGLYAIKTNDLRNTGIMTGNGYTDTARLYYHGKEIPLHRPGIMATGENPVVYVFYADPGKTIYSDFDAYWLVLADKPGLMMRDTPNPIPAVPDSNLMNTYREKLHWEENHLYEENLTQPNGDPWYWDEMEMGQTKAYSLKVTDIEYPGLFKKNIVDPWLRVRLMGKAEIYGGEPNRVQVTLNQTTIGTTEWVGRTFNEFSTMFSATLLKEGDNQLQLTLLNNTTNQPTIFIDSIEIDYARKFYLNQDVLELTGAKLGNPTTQFTVQFSRASGNNYRPVVIAKSPDNQLSTVGMFYRRDGENYTFTVDSGYVYYIGDTSSFCVPSTVTVKSQDVLRSTETGSDIIFITHPDFIPAVRKLADYRKSQGLTSSIVNVNDIYDQFSFGVFDPRAIQQFLQYRYYFGGLPKFNYVVLVGDANWDYKDYQQTGTKNFVPTYRSPQEAIINGDNGSVEDYYLEFCGTDGYPDAIGGRVSVTTLEQMSTVVEKIIAQDTASELSPWRIHAIIATDDGFEIDGIDSARSFLPLWMEPDFIFERDYPFWDHQKFVKSQHRKQAPAVTDDLIHKMNLGSPFQLYIGHGGGGVWSHERIFMGGGNIKGSDVNRLRNQNRNLFVYTMSCLNGYFDYPNYPWDSIAAEEMLRRADRGSIGMLVPMGKGGTSQHLNFGKGMAKSFLLYRNPRLGDAVYLAKLEYLLASSDVGLSHQYFLMGDPLANNAIPQKEITIKTEPGLIAANKQVTVTIRGNTPADFPEGTVVLRGYLEDSAVPFIEKTGIKLSKGKFDTSLKLNAVKSSVVFRAYAWNNKNRMDGSGAVILPVMESAVQFQSIAPMIQNQTLKLKLKNITSTVISNLELRVTTPENRQSKEIARLKSRTVIDPGAELPVEIPVKLKPGATLLNLTGTLKADGVEFVTSTTVSAAVADVSPESDTNLKIDYLDNGLTYSPAELTPGNSITFFVPVYHYGNATIKNLAYQFSFSNLTVFAQGTINNMLPFSVQTIQSNWTIPANYLLEKSLVEDVQPVQFQFLKGKTIQHPITITAPAEITITMQDIKATPAIPEESQTVFFDVMVHNTGKTIARNLSVTAWNNLPDKGGNILDNVTLYPEARITVLKPGEAKPVRLRWDPFSGTYGDKTVYLMWEKTPNNPTKSSLAFPIKIRRNADLSIKPEEISLTPEHPLAGDTVKLTAIIHNIGESTAINIYPWGADKSFTFDVKFYLRDSAGKDKLIDKPIYLDPLPPGQSMTVNKEFSVNKDIVAVVVKLDADNEVLETNEFDNNLAVKPVEFIP